MSDTTITFKVDSNSSNEISNETSEPSPTKWHAIQSYSYIGMYLSIPIFLIGVVGNILTIFVMRRRAFEKTTAAVYLTLLAIADTSLLVTGIPHEWLEWFNIDMHPWPCRFQRFFFYLSSDVSMWTVVLFTFDRFVAVCFPLKKRSVCTHRKAVAAFAVVVILWVTKNLHLFWTRGTEHLKNGDFYRNCGYMKDYWYFEYYVRPWIVFTFISLLPCLLVLFFNILIITSLLRSQRMRRASSPNASGNPFRQTTVMCLSVSFALLICITPSMVMVIGKPYWKFQSHQNHAYDIAKVTINQLVYLNHAINFCLYCMTGERFRSELAKMFGLKKGSSHGASTPITTPSVKPCNGSDSHSAEEDHEMLKMQRSEIDSDI